MDKNTLIWVSSAGKFLLRRYLPKRVSLFLVRYWKIVTRQITGRETTKLYLDLPKSRFDERGLGDILLINKP